MRGDYFCPRCRSKMIEKRPKKDRFLVRNRELSVRLICSCGYYEDRVLERGDFLDNG